MNKKRLFNRIGCTVIALIMILSLSISPIASNVVRAEEDQTEENISEGASENTSEDTSEDTSEGTLEIVSKLGEDENLVFEKGDSIDLASNFTVKYKGEIPYMMADSKNYYSNSDYSSMFTVSYYKVEGENRSSLGEDVPEELGTYEAEISLSDEEYYLWATYEDYYNYYYDPSNSDYYVTFKGKDITPQVIQFEIVESKEVDIDESKVGELKKVYGRDDLADEDAFVLLMFGDGFTADQQDKFYESAEENAEYIMKTSPWDEFSDVVKIYALGTISEEEGATGENTETYEGLKDDTKDTYFKSSFWSYGLERLLAVENYGSTRMKDLQKKYLKCADYSVLIVNSTKYGGSGGEYCVASLNTQSLEMMLHELGHTVADLADEYWSAPGAEKANMTATSDPEEVKWSRFVGKNGIGVYEYDNGGDGWYRPSQTCKMRFLGKQYAFCDVCKEELRKAFCEDSNVTKLFFQPYAETFYEGECKDMKEFFILRKGDEEVTGDQLGDALTLTYIDENGNESESYPNVRGTYKIKAKFAGNDTFEPYETEVEYTVELPNLMDLDIESKVYDGEPAKYTCDVNYEKEYYTEAHYTGSVTYSSSIINSYDSDEAPTKPGDYEIVVTAYDKETKEAISRKTKAFSITFKQTPIVDNNSSDYPGASVEYNNRTIVITGEGFTAEEQDEFEKLAEEYKNYILNTEPFKETQLYFNFTTVEAESNESGIGEEAGDTYFKLYCDNDGKIITNSEADEAVTYLGYNIVTAYYKAAIVIVNDKNEKVKEGATTGRAIYGGTDENSMAYVTRELLNYLTSEDAGYVADTDEKVASQRSKLIRNLGQYWYYEDYAVILSRAYNETFVENGSPIELDDYFHTYLTGNEVPNSELKYEITYYDSDGNKLDGAPSKAGTYSACAELNPPEDGYYMETYDETVRKMNADEEIVEYEGYYYVYDNASGEYTGWALYFPATEVTVDGESHLIPRARGCTTFRISSVQEAKIQEAQDYLKQASELMASDVEQAKECLDKAQEALEAAGEAEETSIEARQAMEKALKEAQKQLAEAIEQSAKDQAAAEEALKKAEAALKEAEEAKKEAELAKQDAANQIATAKFQAKKATVKSVKSSSKKALKVTWKAVSGAEGYQIQYSKKSNFKGAKTVTVKSASKKTTTIKKLTSKKKYYVRVRAYKTIDGKKVYTSWSSKKSVKVK